MKKLMKLALVAVLALSATTVFGQKFGRVDLAAIVPNMPEYKEAVANLEAYGLRWSSTHALPTTRRVHRQ